MPFAENFLGIEMIARSEKWKNKVLNRELGLMSVNVALRSMLFRNTNHIEFPWGAFFT